MSLILNRNEILKILKHIYCESLMNMNIFNKIIGKICKVTIFDITFHTFQEVKRKNTACRK